MFYDGNEGQIRHGQFYPPTWGGLESGMATQSTAIPLSIM